MRRRIAFIDYFPTHYRRRLYAELARRCDADFYFFADERERYWNSKIPLARDGGFDEVSLKRYRIVGNAVMPGIVRTLSRDRYDAVVKSLNGKLMLPLTYATARARGLPFVLWTGMWMHPQTTAHRLSLPLTERIYRGADAIVVYGEHVRQFVLQTPGVCANKVFVAGQAVEGERFTAVSPAFGGLTPEVLYVGQFEERKGLDYLFAAAERLQGLPFRLRLVGNGSLQEHTEAQAARLGNVDLVGHVPQADLPRELARSRCLVLPSVTTKLDREPWGLVVNEAMHAGLPVVTTDRVGAAAGGLVRDGVNGFVVPERDAAALADALRRLITEPQTAAALGAQARTDVALFTHERMANAFVQAVEHAMAARR